MNMKKSHSIDEIKEKLAPLYKEEGLQLVLLFGSAASGRTHRKSDIDLAFLYDKPVDALELTNKVIKLLHTDSADVVDLQTASPLLGFSAAKHGKILYERSPGVFNSFYSLAFRKYIDTRKIRQGHEDSIKSFLEEKGLV
jgi:predicted nucleotidyltransferase